MDSHGNSHPPGGVAMDRPTLLTTSRSRNSVGGLSRSSRSNSLAIILASSSPTSPSPIFDSGASSECSSRELTPPSTATSTTAGGSATGTGTSSAMGKVYSGPLPPDSSDSGYSYYGTGTGGTTTPNPGFVVTSRPKPYHPSSSSNAPSNQGSTKDLSSTLLPNNFHPLPPSPRQGASSAPPPSTAPRYLRSDYHAHPQRTSSSTGLNSPLPPLPLPEPKTTLTLSSSIDSKGRRMVNQYVRLKTIGQGSHGKVWLCAEPTGGEESGGGSTEGYGVGESERRRAWEEEIESGDVKYCAIKSVAREGVGRGKSLKTAQVRKAERDAAKGGTGAATAGTFSTGIGKDDQVKREVAIMKRLDHKNVVRLKEVIDDAKSKKVFMVLEFMAGGQIVWQDDDKNPTMTVDEARRTFRDVVLGLEYLHYQGIIHRDIKPANLLWTEDHSIVKISDFGVSHVSDALVRASPGGQTNETTDDDLALRKTAGSPAFFAPELLHAPETSTYLDTPRSLSRSSPNTAAAQAEDGYFFRPPTSRASTGSPSLSTPTSSRYYLDSPTTPNGTRRTDFVISKPLPPSDPNKPRRRPTIGKGIDVWALGVTLYCLLFGDTPFMAQTEYELYNIIVREGVRVPEKMGKEGKWTGIGKGWEGAGDGVEGREVVDLLARLLEKDPSKRITLEQVKKHPWVLRDLPSSPDSWLCETDPAQTHTVVVTEEDVQQATQQRGAVDVLPQIRNRTGLRRALHAALVRFPAFSSKSKTSDPTQDDEDLRRRQSTSSNSASAGPSRQPSDSSTKHRSSNKVSSELVGLDLRRILSGKDCSPPPSTTASPANGKSGGGWAYRTSSFGGGGSGKGVGSGGPAQDLGGAELWKSSSRTSVVGGGVSSSSTAGGGGNRNLSLHLFPPRRKSDCDPSNPSSPPPSSRSASSAGGPNSDVDSTGGRRRLSKVLSLLGGGGSSRSRTTNPSSEGVHSIASEDDDECSGPPSSTHPDDPHAMDSRLDRPRGSLTPSQAPSGLHRGRLELDPSEFEYSSDEDNDEDVYGDDDGEELDDFEQPPLADANGLRGWNVGFAVAPFGVDFQRSGTHHLDDQGDESDKITPSTRAFENGAHPVRQNYLDTLNATTLLRNGVPGQGVRNNSSVRDGSIRNGVEGAGMRKWTSARDSAEEDDEEDGTEIFLAPRRRRAATLSKIE